MIYLSSVLGIARGKSEEYNNSLTKECSVEFAYTWNDISIFGIGTARGKSEVESNSQ